MSIRVFLAGTLLTLMLAGMLVQAQLAAPAQVEHDLQQIEQDLVTAWVKKDRTVIDRTLAPEWSVIDVSGHEIDKPAILKMFDTGAIQISSGKIDEVKIRLLSADVAVVTGKTLAVGASPEQAVTLRFTDVFLRRSGKWVIVASQGTPIQGN